jgi:sterol desaturase/sphingolipid hydroxylase (fatty acid hydroxylase superfamily)
MIDALIAQWRSLPPGPCFGVACLIEASIYLACAGGVSLVYGGMQRWLRRGTLLDPRPLAPRQVQREAGMSMVTCAVYAAFALAGLRICSGNLPASWTAGAVQVACLLLFYDFCTYWTHRLFHTRGLRPFHHVHHRSVRPTPWSVYRIHPLEAAVNQLQILLFMAVWPTSAFTMLLFQFFVMLGGAIGHGNFDPFGAGAGPGLKRFIRFHQRHHANGAATFGFAGPHWDAVFGTLEPVQRTEAEGA